MDEVKGTYVVERRQPPRRAKKSQERASPPRKSLKQDKAYIYIIYTANALQALRTNSTGSLASNMSGINLPSSPLFEKGANVDRNQCRDRVIRDGSSITIATFKWYILFLFYAQISE